jgi:hypothetical protein
MAQPVFSFKNSSNNTQYYFILDTYGDLPACIPMDIVSFLNYFRYKSNDYEDFLRTFHDVYPILIEHGSTLQDARFEDLSLHLRTQIVALSGLHYSLTGKIELFEQIETLFITERNFKRFSFALYKLIKPLRQDLPRPLEFYNSWRLTFDALDQTRESDYFKRILVECGLVKDEKIFTTHFLIEELANNLNPAPVVRFFLQCLSDNKIPLDAVPHVLRSEPAMKRIFVLYGADLLVPDVAVNTDVYWKPVYSWMEYPMHGVYLKRFTEHCLYSDFGLADEIRIKLVELGRPLFELSDEEVYSINDFSFENDRLQNYSNESGNYLLPFRYIGKTESTDILFLSEIHSNNIIPFGKKRLNQINCGDINLVGSIHGNLIEINPSGFWGDEQLWWSDAGKSKLTYIRKSNTTIGDIGFISDETCKFSEEKSFYFLSGWFNLKNKPLSPLCFTSAGRFSEGLAPVCLNGRWGFVDKSFNIAIEAQFGHAEPFDNGRAKVFILNEPFTHQRGNWIELPTWVSLSEDDSTTRNEKEFARKYPTFPAKHRIPIYVLFNRCWNTVQKSLGYFGNSEGIGLLPSMGRYVYIDQRGNVVDENGHHNVRELIEHDWSRNKRFGKKIDDEAFMLKSMVNKKINYGELPIHYKIKDAFIREALYASLISLDEVPLQFRAKAKPIINQINKRKSIHLIKEKLNAVLNRRRPIKSIYELLLIHSGKHDDMQFRALTIKPGKPVTALIDRIAENIHNESKNDGLTNDYSEFANLLCQQLQRSGKFNEAEMDEFSILLNPEGARTIQKKALNRNKRTCFHLFCGDELYQPDSYSAFYNYTTDWDYIKLCKDYLTSHPIEMHETSNEIFKRIIRYLNRIGCKALAHIEIPISEATVGHLIPNKVKQVSLITPNSDASELDDLPF